MKTSLLKEDHPITALHPSRLIGHIKGTEAGATVIFTAGIHGNEPTGVLALEEVIGELSNLLPDVKGSIYALKGNLAALKQGVRYLDEDLNRVWNRTRMEMLDEISNTTSEASEQNDIWGILSRIIEEEQGPFYFFDLHTTSCQTIPFLTVNDTLLNRQFTSQYPAPIILGIEEYLEGPLLSFVNELGYVAFGFEGGQHDDSQAVINHADFIRLSLCFTENINKESINYSFHYNRLKKASESKHRFYEIYDYQPVAQSDQFKMTPGYRNFQRVTEGEILAQLNKKNIVANEATNILMPLYQQQGDDGFFFVKFIPHFFLWLSKYIRKVSFMLILLPGVRWNGPQKTSLLVNQQVAKYFTKNIFHLFGFRSRKLSGKYWVMYNREKNSRISDYSKASWSR